VHVDHAGYAVAPRDGVRLSIDGGNPIPELDLRGAALYAPTERALAAAFPGGAVEALAAGAGLVVVTRGADGCFAVRREGGERLDVPGYATEVVSTLGAGDVFHGAVLAALVRGRVLREALAQANWCAARSCRALDGRTAIPTADELAQVPA
jgi:sugar/nucleoside kinase (ribokinase family)